MNKYDHQALVVQDCCDPNIDQALLTPVDRVVLVAAVVLINASNELLLCKRPPGTSMSGLWEFPGGKIEVGETPEAAAVRELTEELGVKTCAGCLMPLTFASHRYDEFHLLMPLFACRKYEGIPKGLEGQELVWIKANQLHHYDMPEANRVIIGNIRDLL